MDFPKSHELFLWWLQQLGEGVWCRGRRGRKEQVPRCVMLFLSLSGQCCSLCCCLCLLFPPGIPGV